MSSVLIGPATARARGALVAVLVLAASVLGAVRIATPASAVSLPIAVTSGGGAEDTCAYTSNGPAECWGINVQGELGLGNTKPSTTPAHMGLGPVLSLSTGSLHTCAVTAPAAVQCWGDNTYGQLGNGTTSTTPTLSPGPPIPGLNATQVAAGSDFSCAITTSGPIQCWGANNAGQLGNGTYTPNPSPVLVSKIPAATQIGAGGDFACALKPTGKVACWGDNTYGQLGATSTAANSNVPVPITLEGTVKALTVGGTHACALLTTGALYCWGTNTLGELGDGAVTTDEIAPKNVGALGTGVAQAAAGANFTCALLTNGGVDCWGLNAGGELGNGTQDSLPHPLPQPVFGFLPPPAGGSSTNNVAQVAAGPGHACLVVTWGGMYCWGLNYFGELGNGTKMYRNTPGLVIGLTTGVQAISEGSVTACALTAGLGVKCWGLYTGSGDLTEHDSAVQVKGLTSNMTLVTAGGGSACAVSTFTGSLRCWGNNLFGQLGNNSTNDAATPVQPAGLSSGILIDVMGNSTGCAAKAGKTACWGYNGYGQVGDGSTTDRHVPTSIGIGVTQLSGSSGLFTCAITPFPGAAAYCWGNNNAGQLGDGTTSDRHTPTPVAGLPAVPVQISAGGGHSCALLVTAEVYCWGGNTEGQLGTGTTSTTPSLSPVKVQNLAGPVTAISLGNNHSCALISTGMVQCWGINNVGELGNGTTVDSPVPVTPISTGVVAISAHQEQTCAVLSSGSAQCWGYNNEGELGNGTNLNFSDVPTTVMGL